VAKFTANPAHFYGFLEVDVVPAASELFPVLGESKRVGDGAADKLIFDNTPKRKYVIFSEQLVFAMQRGVVLKKVRACLRFEKNAWMKRCVEMWERVKVLEDEKGAGKNGAVREAAKLLMNSLYGKTLQRIHRDLTRILYSPDELLKGLRMSRTV